MGDGDGLILLLSTIEAKLHTMKLSPTHLQVAMKGEDKQSDTKELVKRNMPFADREIAMATGQ